MIFKIRYCTHSGIVFDKCHKNVYCIKHTLDQNVENASVAFIKGADERNKFFEK